MASIQTKLRISLNTVIYNQKFYRRQDGLLTYVAEVFASDYALTKPENLQY